MAVVGLLTVAVPAVRTASPTAEMSLAGTTKGLSVGFVAAPLGLAGPLASYHWTFGDGKSATTSSGAVTHVYAAAGTYGTAVTIANSAGTKVTARGTLRIHPCGAASGQCSASLGAATVSDLALSGRAGAGGAVDLFVDPYRFSCEPERVAPAVAAWDAGFTGKLVLTLDYTTSAPNGAEATCFQSPTAFTDVTGQRVHTGDLPGCRASGGVPPCVSSVVVDGSAVSKSLVIPAGDPRVGAP